MSLGSFKMPLFSEVNFHVSCINSSDGGLALLKILTKFLFIEFSDMNLVRINPKGDNNNF